MTTLRVGECMRTHLGKNVEVVFCGIPGAKQRVIRLIRGVEGKVIEIHALANCTNCNSLGERRGENDAYSCYKLNLKISDICYGVCPDHEFRGGVDQHLERYLDFLVEYALERFPKKYEEGTEGEVLRQVLIEGCGENPEFVDLYFQQIYSKIFSSPSPEYTQMLQSCM